jgi:outer membrane protein assembly factor BamB
MPSLFLCAVLLAAPPESQWPAFLGGGKIEVSEKIPLSWSREQIAWTQDLPGYGQSSPVVAGGQAFVTSIEGPRKEKCHVIALDLTSGRIAWTHSFDAAEQAENNNYTSKAAPTPTTDGESLFAFFESGDVVSLSLSGDEQWKRSLTADYGKFTTRHGLAASPLLVGDALVMLLDHEGPSYLVALDKRTGKTLWKTDRKSRTSWSSPALLTIGGQRVIVCSSSGSVDGYSPESGELLWSYDQVDGNTTNTPIAYADGCFLIGAGTGAKTNLALSVKAVDGKWTSDALWSSTQASSSFGSPIVYAGHAYFVNKTGVLYCLDAKTGEVKYTERLKQTIWATPLGSGDRIYFFGKGGLVTVITIGPKFKVLAESELWSKEAKPAEAPTEAKPGSPMPEMSGPVLYGVAVVGDQLLLRRGDRLYCVRP